MVGPVFVLRRWPQAGGTVEHDQHHGQAVQQLAQHFRLDHHVAEQRLLGRLHHVTQYFGYRGEDHAAEDHAGDMADTAQHHHGQHGDRFRQRERFRRDKALERGKHGAGHAAERGAHGKGQQFDVARIDAHGLGGDLVFADGHPGTAQARMLQALGDEHDGDAQKQEQKVIGIHGRHGETGHHDGAVGARLARQVDAEDADRVDQIDALRPVREIDRVVQIVHEDADDLAKAQGHDGQIVAAQLQGRRTQQGAEQARHGSGQRHDEPDRQMDAVFADFRPHQLHQGFAQHRILIHHRFEQDGELRRGQQGRQVGTHGIEGDIAEVEQAGEADDDVQAQGQHDVQQGHVDDAHPGVAELRGKEREHHQQRGQAQHAGVGFGRIFLSVKIE